MGQEARMSQGPLPKTLSSLSLLQKLALGKQSYVFFLQEDPFPKLVSQGNQKHGFVQLFLPLTTPSPALLPALSTCKDLPCQPLL